MDSFRTTDRPCRMRHENPWLYCLIGGKSNTMTNVSTPPHCTEVKCLYVLPEIENQRKHKKKYHHNIYYSNRIVLLNMNIDWMFYIYFWYSIDIDIGFYQTKCRTNLYWNAYDMVIWLASFDNEAYAAVQFSESVLERIIDYTYHCKGMGLNNILIVWDPDRKSRITIDWNIEVRTQHIQRENRESTFEVYSFGCYCYSQ